MATLALALLPTGSATLQVAGNISTNGQLVSTSGGFSLSDQGLVFNNKLVCSANGCVSSSSPSPTPTSPTIDVANLAYLNANDVFSGADSFSAKLQANGGISTSGVDSSGGYSVNGTAGANISCGASQLLQQGVILGGIIIGGSCVSVAGGTVPSLQQVYDASTPATTVLE